MLPIFLIAILVAFLQFTAVAYTRLGQTSLDLPLIALVFFGLRRGPKTGAALGFFFGCYGGIFSTLPFLPHLILYTSVGFIDGLIGKWFYKDSLLTFIAAILCSLGLIYAITSRANFFAVFLPAATYNIAVSIFLFYFFKGLKV